MSCLECSLAMIESHASISKDLEQNNLPKVNYRISLDYGSVVLMRTNNSNSQDMLGPQSTCVLRSIMQPKQMVQLLEETCIQW